MQRQQAAPLAARPRAPGLTSSGSPGRVPQTRRPHAEKTVTKSTPGAVSPGSSDHLSGTRELADSSRREPRLTRGRARTIFSRNGFAYDWVSLFYLLWRACPTCISMSTSIPGHLHAPRAQLLLATPHITGYNPHKQRYPQPWLRSCARRPGRHACIHTSCMIHPDTRPQYSRD